MNYTDQYIEIGPNTTMGIGITQPVYPLHTKNIYLNQLKNITSTSGFKIQVASSPLSMVPIGTIVLWALPLNAYVTNPMDTQTQTYLPKGWLPCNGQSLNRLEYPDLFNLLQYDFGGSGDSFLLPDFRADNEGSYAICNRLNTSVLLNNTTYRNKRFGGDRNGSSIKSIQLLADNLPTHYHYNSSTNNANGYNNHGHNFNYQNTGNDGDARAGPFEITGEGTFTSTSSDSSVSHYHGYTIGMTTPGTQRINMEQTYLTLSYIICVQ